MFVAGIIMLVASVALLVVAVALARRGSTAWAGCTAHAFGRVTGVSPIAYGGHHIPRCSYEVAGRAYTVDGPRFESGTVAPGLRTNVTSREHLPRTLRAAPLSIDVIDASYTVSNEHRYERSVLSTLYPMGSEVDVWYDPVDPAHAYVQRPVRPLHLLVVMLCGWGGGAFVMGLTFLFVARSAA